MVYFFFDSSCRQQSINGDILQLTDPPRPLSRLGVCARVPVGVIQDHAIGPRQIDPQPTYSSCQQEYEDGRILLQTSNTIK